MENLLEVPFVFWDADVDDVSRSFGRSSDNDGWYIGPEDRESLFPENHRLLIAVYTYESYSGKAFVLYEHDGKLFEVNASHCSCYGLENQFDPEETTWAALLMRDFEDTWYGYDNPWNTMNDRIAALAAERGVYPKPPRGGG